MSNLSIFPNCLRNTALLDFRKITLGGGNVVSIFSPVNTTISIHLLKLLF